MYKIGIDIGGTAIKFGLVSDKGEIVYRSTFDTAKTFDGVVSDIVDATKAVLDKFKLKINEIGGIGIGCPGLVVSKDGVVKSACNLGWENVPIVQTLKNFLDTKIVISNDANVAALGEAVFGAGKGYDNIIMITLGTGVGGGIVLDGKLFEGVNSLGTEIGHATLVHNGIQCACGRKGCIEQYVSTSALVRNAKNAMIKNKDSILWKLTNNDIEQVNGKIIFEAFRQGDRTTSIVVKEFISYLADTIMSYNNIFRPEIFIIGGGISNEGSLLTDMLVSYCSKFDYGCKGTPIPVISTAHLGNDAGLIGASRLV